MYTSSLKFAAGNGTGIRERVARLNANGNNPSNNNNNNHHVANNTSALNNNGFTSLTVTSPTSYNYCGSSSLYAQNGSMEPLSLDTVLKSPDSMESKCTFVRTNSASQIPLARSRLVASANPSSGGGAEASRWQSKYEEAERRRKTLLAQNQKGQLICSLVRFLTHCEKK